MPTIQPAGSRVLVTGANGFIAMWVIRALLEQGFSVRGVIRSVDKGKRLQEYFASYGNKLELIVVEDMMRDGAFDEAVKGIDAIEHMASPVTLSAIEPDDYIQPALRGTLGILESALKFGQKVKRIVITSSCGAINRNITVPTHIFDETQWGDEAVETVRNQGINARPMTKYCASKVLAERAAWNFYEKHKHEIQWDLVVLHPPFVLGPALQEAKTPNDLNVSLKFFYNMLTDTNKSDEELKISFNFVDVRDVSKAHVDALKNEQAAGQRIIIANGASTWQEARNLAYSSRPDLYVSGFLPRGNPALENTIMYRYSPEKGKKILGLQYISKELMVSDLLADYESRGWFKKQIDV